MVGLQAESSTPKEHVDYYHQHYQHYVNNKCLEIVKAKEEQLYF